MEDKNVHPFFCAENRDVLNKISLFLDPISFSRFLQVNIVINKYCFYRPLEIIKFNRFHEVDIFSHFFVFKGEKWGKCEGFNRIGLRVEKFYRNGKKHGEYKLYGVDDTIILSGYYKNGLKDGNWKRYHCLSLLEDYNYVEGKKEGICRDFTIYGDLHKQITHKKGHIVKYEEYYPGTKVCMIYNEYRTLTANVKELCCKHFNIDGTLDYGFTKEL